MDILTYNNTAYTSLIYGEGSKGAIVLLDGIPSVPAKKDVLIKELSTRGYDIFFPRYDGTWESSGDFLARSPTEGIEEFINKLKSGIELQKDKYTAKAIFILGASFGGGIALSLANNPNIDKVIALSPVLSFKNVAGIETLEKYLADTYPDTYRFQHPKWQHLIDDGFYCPQRVKIEHPKKVLMVGGLQDDQISIKDLQQYSNTSGISLIVEDRGHLTLSKIDPKLLDIIEVFIK